MVNFLLFYIGGYICAYLSIRFDHLFNKWKWTYRDRFWALKASLMSWIFVIIIITATSYEFILSKFKKIDLDKEVSW